MRMVFVRRSCFCQTMTVDSTSVRLFVVCAFKGNNEWVDGGQPLTNSRCTGVLKGGRDLGEELWCLKR
jgi:hypothetical protein